MPGVSRRPRGQIPLPSGDGGHGPLLPLQPRRGLARAFTRHERRTDSSEKSNNPPAAGAGCDPVLGAGGAQGGPPAPSPPPRPWAAGYAAIYFSTSPLLRQGPAWALLLPLTRRLPARALGAAVGGRSPQALPHGQRGDSRGPGRSAAPSRARPCHPSPGSPCRAQLAGHSPPRRPPAPSPLRPRRLPGPPVTRHTAGVPLAGALPPSSYVHT